MEEYSYKNTLHLLYFGMHSGRSSTSEADRIDEIFKRMPEFKKFDKVLSQSSVLQRMFNTTMANIIENMPKNAIFYADKLKTLTDSDPISVYLLGEAYYQNENFKKIYYIFEKHNLLHKNDNYLILAAKGLINIKEYTLCQQILEKSLKGDSVQFAAMKNLLLAQCMEETENKECAKNYYMECLKHDPTCVQAFTQLMDSHAIDGPSKEKLIHSITLRAEDAWLKQYYLSYIKKLVLDENKNTLNTEKGFGNNIANFLQFESRQSKISPLKSENYKFGELKLKMKTSITPENTFSHLTKRENIDILCIKANNAYSKYDITSAHELCLKVIQEDALKLEILPIYCCCLLEKEDYSELYKLSVMLMQNYPKHPVSHYAVGQYHFLLNKYELARKYFNKANSLDTNFFYSWIAIGHTYAITDECDNASSAYRTCQRLFPGSHLPHLYIGMEYLRTNNLEIALLSFNKSVALNKEDPIVYNQLGVVHFKRKEYELAQENYKKAISLCTDSAQWIIHDIYSNLGQCMRKMGDNATALEHFLKCLRIDPKNEGTLFNLAFTYHIDHQLDLAKEYYSKMMNYQTENQFANEMLTNCFKDLTDFPCETILN